ncbi:hypothetical protein CPL00151_CDS0082 [Escherichia phage Delraymugoa]
MQITVMINVCSKSPIVATFLLLGVDNLILP